MYDPIHFFSCYFHYLIEDNNSPLNDIFRLTYLTTTAGNVTIPTATVKIIKNNKVAKQGEKQKRYEILQEAACGSDPVEAAYKAIDKIVQASAKAYIQAVNKAISSHKNKNLNLNLKETL